MEINLLRNADFSIPFTFFTGSAVPTELHTEPGRSWQLGESSDEFLANNQNYKANNLYPAWRRTRLRLAAVLVAHCGPELRCNSVVIPGSQLGFIGH